MFLALFWLFYFIFFSRSPPRKNTFFPNNLVSVLSTLIPVFRQIGKKFSLFFKYFVLFDMEISHNIFYLLCTWKYKNEPAWVDRSSCSSALFLTLLLASPTSMVRTLGPGNQNWEAAGLKFDIVEPLKRFRVTYNGLLKKVDDSSLHHVRLNFV